MPATVEFSDDAMRMLDDADERWIAEHGYLALNPLVAEVELATERLRQNPESGMRFRRSQDRRPEIRRVLLSTGWHLYYSFDASQSLVVIVAVWFASRGSTPPL